MGLPVLEQRLAERLFACNRVGEAWLGTTDGHRDACSWGQSGRAAETPFKEKLTKRLLHKFSQLIVRRDT